MAPKLNKKSQYKNGCWTVLGLPIRPKPTIAVASIMALFAVYYATQMSASVVATIDVRLQSSMEAEHSLREHSKIFEERIVKVTDGVYVAIGYALANMILLEGIDGIVIVDTTESAKASRKIFADFRKITAKPLKAIILTHFHMDHVGGVHALVEDNPDQEIRIFGHSTLKLEADRFAHLGGAAYPRSLRQFGRILERKTENVNSGIGPFLNIPKDPHLLVGTPTETFDKNLTVEVAGLKIELYHTPGETDDHVTAWLPDREILLPGDNIYEAFPNLYAIRGSPPRNPHTWYKSLDFVRSLDAQYMVPSHTRPLTGKKLIFETLTAYRDAIQFVHDQTVRRMNKGLGIDDIVPLVKLPPTLSGHPFLQEFYGTVAWSVRGVYDLYNGWFDGDPVNLFPLTKQERARRWGELLTRKNKGSADGAELILKYARQTLDKADKEFRKTKLHPVDDLQWALELAANGMEACGGCVEGKKLVVEALMRVAATVKNANARNYYLTCAKELRTGITLHVTKKDMKAIVSEIGLDALMASLPYKFNADNCDGKQRLGLAITFTDVEKTFLFELRNCMIQYTQYPDKLPTGLDAHVHTTTAVWYAVIKEEKSGFRAYASGEIKVEGSLLSFRNLLSSLDPI